MHIEYGKSYRVIRGTTLIAEGEVVKPSQSTAKKLKFGASGDTVLMDLKRGGGLFFHPDDVELVEATTLPG